MSIVHDVCNTVFPSMPFKAFVKQHWPTCRSAFGSCRKCLRPVYCMQQCFGGHNFKTCPDVECLFKINAQCARAVHDCVLEYVYYVLKVLEFGNATLVQSLHPLALISHCSDLTAWMMY